MMKHSKSPSLALLHEILVYIRDNVPPENRLIWQQMIALLNRGIEHLEIRIDDLEAQVYLLERDAFEGFGEDWQDALLRDIQALQGKQPDTDEADDDKSEEENDTKNS